MARLLQIHSDGQGARTALGGGLAKALKGLAGNNRGKGQVSRLPEKGETRLLCPWTHAFSNISGI